MVEHNDLLCNSLGYIAVIVSVVEQGATFEGTAAGRLEFTIESLTTDGEKVQSTLRLEMRIKIAPTPPREKRILWDQERVFT